MGKKKKKQGKHNIDKLVLTEVGTDPRTFEITHSIEKKKNGDLVLRRTTGSIFDDNEIVATLTNHGNGLMITDEFGDTLNFDYHVAQEMQILLKMAKLGKIKMI